MVRVCIQFYFLHSNRYLLQSVGASVRARAEVLENIYAHILIAHIINYDDDDDVIIIVQTYIHYRMHSHDYTHIRICTPVLRARL